MKVDYEPAAEPEREDGTPPPPSLDIVTAGQLMTDHPELNEPLIQGMLRICEVFNIIAGPKARKSWLILYLLLCIATGRAFLGRFPVKRGRVLLVDNELHRGTLSKRLQRVAAAMGLLREDYAANLQVSAMRGKSATLDRLRGPLCATSGQYAVICIDALYKAFPPGVDENSNSDMTSVYNLLDEIAESTRSAIVVVHHTSKGDQSGKSVTDAGAGAGAQSRAADMHLTIREHEVKDCVSVEAAVRSWEPLQAFVMRWDFPLWRIDEGLDPADLKRPARRGAKAKDVAATSPEPKPEPWTPERFASVFITDTPRTMADLMALATTAGVSRAKATDLLKVVRLQGLAFQWFKPKSNAVWLCRREQTLQDTL